MFVPADSSWSKSAYFYTHNVRYIILNGMAHLFRANRTCRRKFIKFRYYITNSPIDPISRFLFHQIYSMCVHFTHWHHLLLAIAFLNATNQHTLTNPVSLLIRITYFFRSLIFVFVVETKEIYRKTKRRPIGLTIYGHSAMLLLLSA